MNIVQQRKKTALILVQMKFINPCNFKITKTTIVFNSSGLQILALSAPTSFMTPLCLVLNIHILVEEVWHNLFPLMWCVHMHFPAVSGEGLGAGATGGSRCTGYGSGLRRKGQGRQETGGPAGCWGFEPNRWWRLGDVPSPGLSPVIEDNLSTKESRPVHCQAERREARLIWKWFCITAGFARLAARALPGPGPNPGLRLQGWRVSPWVQAQRHTHEYITQPRACAPH